MRSRRPAALAIAALALVVASCSASNGAEAPPDTAISGLGVLPSVPPLAGEPVASLDSIPASILPSETRKVPEITDPRVFMEGDSVLRGMAIGDPDAIDLYVGALGWDVTVDAEVGRFTDEGVSEIKRRSSEVGQVIVAMLGNNYGGDKEEYASQVLDLLGSFPDAREIVMFTVPLYKPNRVDVNDVLRTAAQIDDRLVLIDWEKMSREIPGALSSDRLHPTGYGADLLAQAVGITLGKAPGAGPDVTLPSFGASKRPALPGGVDTNKGETRNDSRRTTVAAGTKPKATTTTAAATSTTVPSTATTVRSATTTTKPASSTVAPSSTTSTSASTTVATTASTAVPTTAPPAPTTVTTTAAPTTAAPPAPST